MSLTRLKYLMQEGTDDEIAAYLQQLGLANGAPMIGEIFYWPHPQLPQDVFSNLKGMVFLRCNGQSFDGNLYPELAKILPSKIVPELRGEFIRCWDDGKGQDAGRQIATWQDSTALSQFGGNYPEGSGHAIDNHDGIRGNQPGFSRFQYTSGSVGDGVNFVRMRPRNVALLAIIRAK